MTVITRTVTAGSVGSAVNHWGRLGEWEFLVCREPQQLAEGFAKLISARDERIRGVAAELQAQAEKELERLRSLGWKQADFARALKELLEIDELPGRVE